MPRNPIRLVVRFVSHVLILSGVLLIADAGVTVAWQEPVSALAAGHQQQELEKSFEHPSKAVLRRKPLPGDAIGRIRLPALHRSYYVVEGDDAKNLQKGPGHYPDTKLPGEGGTVGVAGHRTTHGAPFRTIDKLRKGDRITMEMPYGTYVYRVQKTKIVDPTEVSVKRNVGYDRLILSACHPLYSAAQRIVVFARLESHRAARVKKG